MQTWKRYKFTVAEHHEYGSLGFKPSWYPAGDPLGGLAVAHDILEHFPKDDGSAEGEYQALGSALWLRGDSGYFQSRGNVNPPEVHLASDFPMIWGIQGYVKECPLVRDSELMETCREIVRLGVKNIQEESSTTPPSAIARENIARWMAKGYKRAQKRYKNVDAYTVSERLFRGIEESADKALGHAEQGMELVVSVDFKNLKFRSFLDYPEEY
jgi:hypothetical protein